VVGREASTGAVKCPDVVCITCVACQLSSCWAASQTGTRRL
jgi:hypothetical protein